MKKTFALIFVSAVTLALCCEAVDARTVPRVHRHRHERHRRFQNLQDQIDRLDLRQKTDHILIENLQKALKEVQDRGAWRSREPPDEREEKEQKAATRGGQRVAWPSRASLNIEVEDAKRRESEERKDQEQRDEILLLREELAALRSEVRVLKEERAAESQHRSSHSLQQEHREALTASWVVENVRRLQDAVEELQEAINVTTALHDKQEVESRLSVVGQDLSALRSSLASVTSKAETAMATVETLREELERTARDSNHARGKVDELGLEVSWIREEFNGLLSALPDGLAVGGLNATKRDSNVGGGEAAVLEGSIARDTDSSALLQKVKNAVQPPRDGLDSSPTSLEHKPKEDDPLEERVKATELGLGEVRASSIQLLEALETLETQVEGGVAEVRQEVAKLEYKVTALQDCAKESQVPRKGSDIKGLRKHIDELETKLRAIQDDANVTEVPKKRPDIRGLRRDIDGLRHRLKDLDFQDSATVTQVPDSHSDSPSIH